MSDLLHATAHESLVHRLQIRADIPNPAAGADFIIPVPGNEDWRLLSVRATLTTSAAVANRLPTLVLDDQTNIGAQVAGVFAHVASTVAAVDFVAENGFASTAIIATTVTIGIPKWVVPGGYRIRSLTGNIQAADQWSGISYMVEIMDDPPYRQPMFGTKLWDEIQHAIEQQIAGG